MNEIRDKLDLLRQEFPEKKFNLTGSPPDPNGFASVEAKAEAFKARAQCTANRQALLVLPNGKVTICEELYFCESFIIGDLNEQTLREVWNSPRALQLANADQDSIPEGACADCPDFRECHDGLGRCYRDVIKAYGEEKAHWPDPRCPRAPDTGLRFV